MPIIKSAKKRVRQASNATTRNLRTKRQLKTAVKSLQKVINSGKKSAGDELKQAQSAIDQAVKKNVMHKNKAARKKRQLARAAKAAGIKPVVKSSTKPASKKSSAEKSTTTKKVPPKKPATKKPSPKK